MAFLVVRTPESYFCFRVRIMKCRVRIVIVSVVVGFILGYNHYYYYYYSHPYPALNNPNPKTEVCSSLIYPFMYSLREERFIFFSE